MTTLSIKRDHQGSAGQHKKAAACCMEAATEHGNAAKSYEKGRNVEAEEHARKAACHCSQAQDHGAQAKAA